ncbi:MAG: hypothetical protein ABSF71_19935 [Terriglobia bacterium]
MAENQPFTFEESIRDARRRLALELRAQAEHIQKLNLELTELQQLHERTEQEANRQWDAMTHVAAAGAAAALAAAAAEAQVSAQTALENVLGAVRALMTCTIPEQVFAILTEEASQWGVRAAIFDVRGKAAWGASAHGFGPALSEKVLRALIVPLNQDNPFRKVCETAGHVEASADTLKKNRNVLDKLKPAPHAPVLLVPIRSAGTVAAIFYADPGEKGDPLPVNALMILAEFAGAQIDRLIALSGGFSSDEPGTQVEEPTEHEASVVEAPVEIAAQAPTEPPVVEPAPAESHVEEPAHAEPLAAAPAPAESLVEEPPNAGPPAEEPASAEASVEKLAEPHAQSLMSVESPAGESAVGAPVVVEPVVGEMVGEVHTIVDEPHVLEAAPPAPEPEPSAPPVEVAVEPPEPVAVAAESEPAHPVTEPRVEEVPPPPPEPVVIAADSAPPQAPAVLDISELSESEQKLHKDAKRFAKLLVSEIELYNKAKVADGRKNRDLYKRLKTDIDRSRQTFEKRFGKTLSKQFDYFHEELVKNLAADDSSVLGPEYPGPPA